MSATGHYACAVTALLACAVYYNASDSSNSQINVADYMSIWDLTRTTVSEQRDGVILGTTQVGYIGPRFVDFCANKGIVVTQKTEYGVKYNFFTNCIDGGNMAVVSCGIIKSGSTSREGHAMAVEGYALLQARNSGRILHTLMIYDGWNDNVRYLNFDFNQWTESDGIAFSR